MIKLGIIGTGGMANGHARAYAAMQDAEVVACCDLVAERVQEFASKWEIEHYYTDYGEM